MSQTLKMKLLEVKFEIKAKLQVAVMIPPTLWPTAAWGSRGGLCCASSVARSSAGSSSERRPSEWGWPGQEAQARPGLPALASNSKI